MSKLPNICLLLAILSLCARLSLGCTTTGPTIEHSTRPSWASCFPDCEEGFKCYQNYLSGLAWVVKPRLSLFDSLCLVMKFATIFNSEFACQFQRKNMKAMTSRLMTSLDNQETILYQGQHQVILRIVRTSY